MRPGRRQASTLGRKVNSTHDDAAQVADVPLTVRVSQVVRLLNVPRSTIYKWVNDGTLPACKVGGIYLIPWNDLQNFLSLHKVKRPKKSEHGKIAEPWILDGGNALEIK